MPSNLPIDTPNCLRTTACALATRAASLAPPALWAGRWIPSPVGQGGHEHRPPLPRALPVLPMIDSTGTGVASLPHGSESCRTGLPSGSCLRSMMTPGVFAGIRAHVIPSSVPRPQEPVPDLPT